MKAWGLTKPSTIEAMVLEDRQIPGPRPYEVLVRWHAASLNFHDYLVCIGRIDSEAGRIPLSDGAGEVVAVGAGGTRWKAGDRVISLFFPYWLEGAASARNNRVMTGDSIDGCAAEYSAVNEEWLSAIPEGYSYEEAATLPCAALTAWRALVVECGIKPGDKLLVEGTGGMSLFCLQIGKMAGAEVFATSSSDDKLERLKALGADHLFNYRTDERWGRAVFGAAEGGVDHVVDAGGAASLKESISAVRVAGNVVLVGVLGGAEAPLNLRNAFAKQLRLQAIAVGSRQMQDDMVRALECSAARPVIDGVLPFGELKAAFKRLEAGAHFGKIILSGW